MRIRSAAACLLLLLAATARAEDSVFVMDHARGFIAAEAEALTRSGRWSRSTQRSGYTGSAYLVWSGPNQSCAALGKPTDTNNLDLTGACQGDSADWIVAPVYIAAAGRYVVDCHNTHSQEDGDNDIWLHRQGVKPPIYRVGSHHPGSWGWLDWGPEIVSFPVMAAGVYRFYFAGRSPGFGIDRIVVFKATGLLNGTYTAPEGARSLSAPVARKVPLSQAVALAHERVARPRLAARDAQGGAALQATDLHGRRVASGHPRIERGPRVIAVTATPGRRPALIALPSPR